MASCLSMYQVRRSLGVDYLFFMNFIFIYRETFVFLPFQNYAT